MGFFLHLFRHISQPTDDWQRSMMSTIFQIHSTAPEREDILAFMTGWSKGHIFYYLITKYLPPPISTIFLRNY